MILKNMLWIRILKQSVNGQTKGKWHCLKNVEIRSFFFSVFSCIQTEYEDLRSVVSPNTGKYGPQKNSYLDIFSRSVSFNSLMHNVQKWSDTLQKSYSIWQKQTVLFNFLMPRQFYKFQFRNISVYYSTEK